VLRAACRLALTTISLFLGSCIHPAFPCLLSTLTVPCRLTKVHLTCLPAAADNPPRPLVMVGDLNNTLPQWKRGGGGIVVQHPHLSQLLRLMVVETGTP
jgi:hypothetical protein